MSAWPSVRQHLAAEARAGSVTRRRALLGMLGVTSAICIARLHTTPVAAREMDSGSLDDWRAFAARYIAPEGRVVDTGNGGVTHSEGQGYGLLFAEHFGDRDSFDRLLDWTRRTLRRPGDALHSWRYRPNAKVPVDDPNNATDGDLLIGWALLRAGQRWGDTAYTDLARTIGQDLLSNCVSEVGGAKVLLPGAFGFEHPGQVVVNPSYYIFPALAAFADAVPDPTWDALQTDGVRLLRLGRFGRWQLPADWLAITHNSLDEIAPAADWPARFSWDAVRVPLNLIWAGLTSEPAVTAAAAFWDNPAREAAPAWVDLATGAVAAFPAGQGVAAIAAITRAARTGDLMPELPHVGDARDYYSASLVLLTRIVRQERLAASATG